MTLEDSSIIILGLCLRLNLDDNAKHIVSSLLLSSRLIHCANIVNTGCEASESQLQHTVQYIILAMQSRLRGMSYAEVTTGIRSAHHSVLDMKQQKQGY